MKALIIIGLLLAAHTPLWAQQPLPRYGQEAGSYVSTPSAAPPSVAPVPFDTLALKPKRGLVARVLPYFAESAKPKPHKTIDFGIIGGPHSASDTGVALGLVPPAL